MTKLKITPKRFKHQVKFLRNIEQAEVAEARWQEQMVTYANITPMCENKFEYIENIPFGSLVTEAMFIFTLRFMPGIDSKMRIMFGNRLFEIKRIIDIAEENRYLQIITLEV